MFGKDEGGHVELTSYFGGSHPQSPRSCATVILHVQHNVIRDAYKQLKPG